MNGKIPESGVLRGGGRLGDVRGEIAAVTKRFLAQLRPWVSGTQATSTIVEGSKEGDASSGLGGAVGSRC